MIIPLDRGRKLIRREAVKHAKRILPQRPRPPLRSRENPVTVCVACLFNFVFGKDDVAKAAITASDRQLTAGDIEYEPPQAKIAALTKRAIVLVAGDFTLHIEAIQKTQRALTAVPENDPAVIAEMYASQLRSIRIPIRRKCLSVSAWSDR